MLVVTAATQGTGWMHFSLAQLAIVYFGLFALPLTLLIWIAWALLRRLDGPRAWILLLAMGALLPVLYYFLGQLNGMRP